MALDRHSAPNSQSSSFDGSQGSQYRPISSDSVTSSSQTRLTGDITPSTSLSNPSSQEQISSKMEQPLHHPVPPSSRASTMVNTRIGQAPVANMGGSQIDYTSAPKRTADGHVKQGSSISPTSPKHDHSRTSSTTSRGSQIGELSNALKTRLTYAMVKVQNGWEGRNINELETHINSAQASPVSTASTLRRSYDSPRPGSSSTQPERRVGGFMQSSERSTATATPDNITPVPHHHVGTAGLDYAYPQLGSAAQSPPSANSGRTYESFWREHSHSNSSNLRPLASSSNIKPPGPSLAPPVDITPRANARRINISSSSQQPPRLQTGISNTSALTTAASIPATPPPLRSQRAPRQNTAEDLDAIETLVYMSSPKNPGYHPSPQRSNNQSQASMPKTPLRQHIELAVDRLQTAQDGRPKLRTEADIDRMLDEMSDGSSSSDGVELLSAGTRRDAMRG